MKTTLGLIAVLIVFSVGWYVYEAYTVPTSTAADYKNFTFTISGQPVTLVNGVSEVPAAPGSTTKVVTKFFGNEVVADLNKDGVLDVAFLVTQEPGGSGTFFYLVGAIKDGNSFKGTQAMLIGDRIAPQTTEYKDGLVIINYAERAPGEPMSTPPSMGKSLYAKYSPVTNDFGEVVQNFEGESAAGPK